MSAHAEIPQATGLFSEPWSASKVRRLLAMFGPAAIVASVSIGAGETIVVVRAGAWAGYGLLWLVLLSAVVKGLFVTYLIGRYTAISGELIGHRLVHLPGPRGWFLLMIVALELSCAPMAWVAIAKPCGNLVHFLLEPEGAPAVWQNGATSAFILLALALSLRLSFARLEKQQILICLLLVVGTALGTAIVWPDLGAALVGSLSFGHLPELPDWAPEAARAQPLLTMATTFGYVGGGVFVYIAYSDWVGLHRWGMAGHPQVEQIRERALDSDSVEHLPEDPDSVRRLRTLASPVRWDVGAGAVVLFVVTAAFMLSGAAVLFPLQTRFEGWSLLTEQAHVWRAIHPSLVWIYYVCILAALWGTLQALPEIYARVMQEFLAAIWPHRDWSYQGIKKASCIWVAVASLTLIWTGVPFDTLIQIASFLLANLAIFFISLGALYLNRKLPPTHRTHWVVETGGWLSAVVLGIFAAISAWGLASRYGLL
jgi:Mn2+/Fe2+ NRAMP family transporter